MAEQGEVADIFVRGMQDIEALEPVERFRFHVSLHVFFRTTDNAYYQFRHGALEAEQFEGISHQLLAILRSAPGMQTYWEDRKDWYSEAFQEYVDNEVMVIDTKGFKLAGT